MTDLNSVSSYLCDKCGTYICYTGDSRPEHICTEYYHINRIDEIVDRLDRIIRLLSSIEYEMRTNK